MSFLRVCLVLFLTVQLGLIGCQKPAQESVESTVSDVPQEQETQEILAEGVLTEFEPGFESISLKNLTVFNSDTTPASETWREEQGVLICTGKPKGYAFTQQSYDNFVIRYDYRFEPSERHRKEGKLDYTNTGVLMYITGEDQIWPKSIEVQGKHMEMASIKENGGISAVEIDDHPEKREAVRKPVGEWNSIEVNSKDGVLTTYLNGEQICQNKPGEVNSGRIGFQSEGFEVHYRNIRIKKTE
ncbi:MAG: DUF1080 domain-containing protein [Planctomycetaceae bacterium]|nr:DUF1080 domain-containing protein [Planctomycetaceae bacterium]